LSHEGEPWRETIPNLVCLTCFCTTHSIFRILVECTIGWDEVPSLDLLSQVKEKWKSTKRVSGNPFSLHGRRTGT
jgi:hypothetical protein